MKKKNRILSKLTALFLCLLMTAGMLGTVAFAAGITENTGTITVKGVEDNVTVTAYKVVDVNFDYDTQQTVDPMYKWDSAVAGWVNTNYPAYINTADNSVKEDFNKINGDVAAEFYDKLAAAIKGGTVSPAVSENRQGDGKLEGLPMGGYLILIENGMKVYRPSAVNVVPEYKEDENAWTMTSPTVQVKSSEPAIDKKVNESESDGHNADVSDSGAIGDTFEFDLRADVPQYPENAVAKEFAISDTLPAGLSLDSGSLKVFGVKGSAPETALSEGAGADYVKSNARPGDKGTTTFTLTFDYDKIKGYEKIHVEYSAKLTGTAAVGPDGNENSAVLDYSNNPYVTGDWKEKTDKVTVYTYGLKVDKVNNSKEFLPGAEFTLSENENGTDAMYFVKVSDGVYLYAEQAEAGATQTLAVGSSGAMKGKLQISGLAKAEKLYLTETKAPGGYNKPSIPVQVSIEDENNDGKPTNGTSSEFGDGFVAIEVINTTGIQLPVTGGIGTVLFTAGGIIVMGAAVILFFVLRRKRAY